MSSEIKNRQNKRESSQKGFKQAVFINHSFNEDDKGRFKEWASAYATQLGDFIDKISDDGYSLSIKRDHYNQCYSAFIQTSDEKSPNYGYILTGRSRSGSMAALAALYRHYVVFEADWPTDTARNSRLDDE